MPTKPNAVVGPAARFGCPPSPSPYVLQCGRSSTAAASITSVLDVRPPYWSVHTPRAILIKDPLKIGMPISKPNSVLIEIELTLYLDADDGEVPQFLIAAFFVGIAGGSFAVGIAYVSRR